MVASTMLGLRLLDWDITKGTDESIDSLPLMRSPVPICMIVGAYFIFVLKLGPAYMRRREPYKLKNLMFIYNVVQVIISAYLAAIAIKSLSEWGLFTSKCIMNDNVGKSTVSIQIWLYCMAKITELLDTVFFVLRKKNKQLTFLHIYHHSSMVLATWVVLKYSLSHILCFTCAINSLVHIVMYTYYALAGLGPYINKYLWWKRYITTFQLVQFVSIIAHYLTMQVVSDCPVSKGVAVYYCGNTFFFLILFANFYMKTFTHKKENSKRKVENLPTGKMEKSQ